jgi:hypothetical protein
MVDGSVSNPNKPCLGIRVLGKKSIGCGYDIVSDLKSPGFNIDRHNLPVIAFFDLLTNLWLIQSIAVLGEFFFAISGLSNCHRLDLVSTIPLDFSLGDRWGGGVD